MCIVILLSTLLKFILPPAAVLHWYFSPPFQSGELPKSVTYSLKRLVRGLGSSTQAMQKGSFTALVAILESFPVITGEAYSEIVENEFRSSDNDTKGVSDVSIMSLTHPKHVK